uniref:Uncharacterized protein n=1 Tax=Caldimicrobium thiodismutans TaxID=1653476 RepID=A0A832LWU9_9BACT
MVYFSINFWRIAQFPSKATSQEKKCKLVCHQWEERKDCSYFPEPNIPPVCTKVKVCVQWEEVCE